LFGAHRVSSREGGIKKNKARNTSGDGRPWRATPGNFPGGGNEEKLNSAAWNLFSPSYAKQREKGKERSEKRYKEGRPRNPRRQICRKERKKRRGNIEEKEFSALPYSEGEKAGPTGLLDGESRDLLLNQ